MKNQLLENDQMPVVSVVMTIYKATEYLHEAMESILNQTFNKFEFIIIVEYSNEQEAAVKELEKYRDSRIVICKNEKNIGIANSLNFGFDIARGKYIARMDDDDISYPNRLEEQVQFLEKHPEIAVVGSNIQMFMGANNVYKQYSNPEVLKCICLFQTPLLHPTVMIRKSELNKHHLRYNPLYAAEDYELWSRVIQFLNIANIPRILLKYRISGVNSSTIKEKEVNDSHNKIMSNQLEKYLNLHLETDELEIISGRTVLTNKKIKKSNIFSKRIKVFSKILTANRSAKFYSQTVLKFVMFENMCRLFYILLKKK